MRLLEYQVKNLFRQYGLPVPVGRAASTAREVKNIAEDIGKAVVIKAQVPVERRGEQGGIRVARTPVEAEEIASEMMTARIAGFSVDKLQVDEAISIQDEYSIVLSIDRATRCPVLLLYTGSTIRIETAANAIPDDAAKISIDPLIGLQRYQVRNLAHMVEFPAVHLPVFIQICSRMWKLFEELDACYIALSPLVITENQRVMALDGKIILDQCAGFRQSFIFDHSFMRRLRPNELEANKQGFVYLEFGGENSIACMANGTGLALATMDLVIEAGGTVADLVDIGSRSVTDHSGRALSLLLQDLSVRAIVVNIYGNMVSCLDIAKRLLNVWNEAERRIPVFVNFSGRDKMEANGLLQDTGIIVCSSVEDAVGSAVAVTKEN